MHTLFITSYCPGAGRLPTLLVVRSPEENSARMSGARRCLVCAVLAALALTAHTQVLTPVGPTPIYRCEEIEMIKFCSYINYTHFGLPNLRNQMNAEDINIVLLTFQPLVRFQCAQSIVHFLCSVFAPFCDEKHPEIRTPPCNSLCNHARKTCKPQLEQYGYPWPDFLECDNFPDDKGSSTGCFGPDADMLDKLRIPPELLDENDNVTLPTISSPTSDRTFTSSPTIDTMNTTDPQISNNQCPSNLQVAVELNGKGYTFNGISNCGVPCEGVYFSAGERDSVAPVIILLFAIACVLFTLFTVATFLIDRQRFHYPERPIIFLSFCYLVIALAYVVGTISKLVEGSGSSFACSDPSSVSRAGQPDSFVFQRLPNNDASYRSASCVILFVVVYFFQMASAIWWVILTLTWFLAAALKWGEEAVEKLWLLYHIIAWSIPAVQVILVLALRLVDGDQLSGLCYTGNHSLVGLGVFVFTPMTIYLVAGLVFFAIGFTALINIHRQVQRDPAKSRKIGRLIIRVAVYSGCYALPNLCLLFLLMYEMAQRSDWEMYYVLQKGCRADSPEPCSSSPTFAAFLLKYVFLFLIGICSSSWVISQKTFHAWQKFFCSCGCRPKAAYDLPNHSASPQHVKAMEAKHHQTAV